MRNMLAVLVMISPLLFASKSLQAETVVDSISELKTMVAENKGKVIYLDFWASWCIPCKKSFPWMNEMQNKYQQQGLTVISVNVDVKQAMAEAFIAEHPANFSVIYDPDGRLAKKFELKGMPSSFIYDRSGKIVQAHTGFFVNKQAQYEAELVELLQQ
ncbi:TlpA disulfide reductase family protein [Thalassotalea sp. Y01]|uniref:TlpA disulfide reductase family protein n=1 Tax=Thalassotalea sp. Y01 TaxID=2729613 RepID=UPI00145F5023|nr:TlpA disulfide reductase family protein [Thalassotalea sp. Y01]NMP15819.1 TlpA family protein disulfide reductase [Thalassotalea sp. Y01]